MSTELILLAVAAVAVVLWSLSRKKAAQVQETAAPAVPAASAVAAVPAAAEVPAPGAAGKLKLYDTPPKTAAMIMAVVADTMGRPLNELRFHSIREVK